MKTRVLAPLFAICLAIGIVLPPSWWPGPAAADEEITLRIATLAPRGSAWMRVFNAWNASLQEATGGRLKLRFYEGGVAGDERDFIRKMAAGQMDGAAVTSTGLGQIVRSVLVLQLPGLFTGYDKIDRVRAELGSDFEQQFLTSGYKLLGWGDVGRGRMFSNRPIRRPEDLRSVRPWAWNDDVIFSTLLQVAGANGVRLGVPEVYPALQTGMVDTFPASALAAVSLQWFTRATHVTKQSDSILVGATILKKDKYDALPADLKAAFDSTSARAHQLLSTRIRRDDDTAYQSVLQRGIQEVDLSPNKAAWDRVTTETRNRLAGRLYSRELLQRVEQLAR